MRVLTLITYYPQYLEAFPIDPAKSYAENREALFADRFSWCDSWSHWLSKLGHECEEVVANHGELQKKWAKEHGMSGGESGPKLLAKQIQAYKPDVVFNTHYALYNDAEMETLKSHCPEVKRWIVWCGAPYSNEDLFRPYDLVLSCVPEIVEQLSHKGYAVRHLNHAFEERVLEALPKDPVPARLFVFIGQLVRRSKFHLKREDLLKYLLKETPLEIYSPTTGKELKPWIKYGVDTYLYYGSKYVPLFKELKHLPIGLLQRRFAEVLSLKSAPRTPLPPALFGEIKEGVFGMKMFRTLQDSKVVLNTHIDISSHSASNMRLFEATGVGSCLLTDQKTNLSSLFEPEKEVLAYTSPEDCAEKAKWLLDHPKERLEIARAGQKRCLENHTFRARSQEFNQILKEIV